MIESMMPSEERQVLMLARKLERIRLQMSVHSDGSHDAAHFNLPYRVFVEYQKAYRASRDEFDTVKAELEQAVRVAECYSPGCAASLIKLAEESAWS